MTFPEYLCVFLFFLSGKIKDSALFNSKLVYSATSFIFSSLFSYFLLKESNISITFDVVIFKISPGFKKDINPNPIATA